MSNSITTDTALKAAQNYIAAGWTPVPVPARQKGPVITGWQNLRLTAVDLPKYFPANGNIGLILGEASGGLVDVDLDSEEAIRAAPGFLPDTKMVHGRQSKPSSHWWYKTTSVPKSERFLHLDGTCIAELRSTGGQTIVPPSVHPSGEDIFWEKTGSPAPIDGITLRDAVARLAVSVLLGKSWPKQTGSRQQVAMAIAGFLLRSGLSEDKVERIIIIAAQLGGDEEYRKRADCTRDTAKALATGKNVIGGPKVAELLSDGSKVIERLYNWLGFTELNQPQLWESPESFEGLAGPPFPVDALPGSIKPYVLGQAAALQVPVGLVVNLTLGVAAAAAAGRCKVRLNPGWVEPLNIFTIAALLSGERKSPTFRAISAPVQERERELLEACRPEIESQQAERDILETQLKTAKAKAAKAVAQNRNCEEMKDVMALTGKLADFKIQQVPRLLADDATSESVASLLAENNGRIAVMSTEGGGI